jgi:tetratricopeptide (TPR) repeat protein
MAAAGLGAHGDLSLQIERASADIKATPTKAPLYLRRAQLRRLDGDWNGALRDFQLARGLDPALPESDLGLGLLWMDRDKPRQALAPLQRFLGKMPEDPKGLGLLAECYQKLGRAGEADAAFRKANLAEPRVELYLEWAGMLKGDRAIEALDEGIRKLGPLVVLEQEAILQERALGRYPAALARLERIMAQASKKDVWMKWKEIILAESKSKGHP